MKSRPKFVSTIAIFSLLGPVIGNVTVVLCIWVTAALAQISGNSDARLTLWIFFFSLLVGGLPFAFLYGFVPAFVTGAIYGLFLLHSEAFRRSKQIPRAIAASLLGAVSTSCSSVWLDASWSLASSSVSFIGGGAVAAFFIGYFWPPSAVFANNPCNPRAKTLAVDGKR